jgi:putative CocE/NonD family hydrolase
LINERDDGIATLQWLARQKWYDGRIAMWGGSAFGHTAWAISDQVNPGPKALFVHIASTDFRGMFYPGNAFSLESALYWTIRSRGDRDREVDLADLDRGAKQLPLIDADNAAIGDTDFYNDWLLNQMNDEYWRKIDGAKVDGASTAETLQAPVLLMGGWFDPFLPTQLADFEAITTKAREPVASQARLIIGPWGHASAVELPQSDKMIPYRQESVRPSIPWFDYQLGVTDAPLNMARVKLFIMGENLWRDENEWPLARANYTEFYLHSGGNANTLLGDGTLSTEPGDDAGDMTATSMIHEIPFRRPAVLC